MTFGKTIEENYKRILVACSKISDINILFSEFKIQIRQDRKPTMIGISFCHLTTWLKSESSWQLSRQYNCENVIQQLEKERIKRIVYSFWEEVRL
ncbi:hypothetical protein ABT56_13830 [Photobacterium aquae]|uniref:Uncharacterized protein n=1 Tax=Photobacterium aquae TaxID=1195763 RepID=A0A0J1GYT6_9GAMM|nr:hypothetical protein ABT56_13830 [Photobacterium aquae]